MGVLNWGNTTYRLQKLSNSDDYELIVMINEDSEFGSELLNFFKKGKNSSIQKVIQKKFPGKKITAVKIMTGGILVCSLLVAPVLAPIFNSYTIEASEQTGSDIKIKFGDHLLSSDTKPVNVNGRLLLPIRVIAETLGANVGWNDSLKEVTVTKGGNTVRLNINNTVGYINGVKTTMDSAPIIKNSRTMVPLRFIAEALNISVDYNDAERTAYVNKEKNYDLYYSVLAGDTVAKIAAKFGTTEQNIIEWNNIKNNMIMAGQFLRVASPALKSDSNVDIFKDMKISQYSFGVVQGYTVKDYPTQTASMSSLNTNIEKVNNC